ncbi:MULTISPECIES: DUF1214 domain-containing protein [unclassified Pseudomonas]|uniref:DUF1214 domain-containing protein n=1 Tax=unclassified Pseudomonas TaxID=196821 RepID=UPI000C87669A|nr:MULTISPECIES: DUF1214 domain-containing protein [unclassified Pseudomonas]PMU08619.1 carboxylesterase [Pseudomonas sp. FW305-20]PMU19397.1 carboxylesterase [Pseudomonas sp. FW305-122]PMU38512.1 carboxylesterase [Pseudomonas sp. FW305-47B]PMX59385.1 carboxylesterase [Pseudomonas sp. FW305-33]PMX69391.1 carboxylesterase [Pseudomonas sp. FW305-60]
MALFGKSTLVIALLAVGILSAEAAETKVNSDNFVRAESDLYFSGVAAKYGFGKLGHERAMAPIDNQTIIRLNRDTLYSGGVFDLDAGPVTITLPDPGKRFLSLQVIDEDHYTHDVHYGAGKVTLSRETIGTRYGFVGIRILANPNDAADLDHVYALQDGIKVSQASVGQLELPKWDKASQDRTRAILLKLAALLPDTKGMFGSRSEVQPVRHLIGAAMAWGGNPSRDALYLNRTVPKNDGQTVYRLKVGKVPVDGFWSITVYNADGYLSPNNYNAYALNNLTAARDADGNVNVQFGGCDGKIANCLPVPAGWNWMVRLYRPSAEILNGAWSFPDVEVVK